MHYYYEDNHFLSYRLAICCYCEVENDDPIQFCSQCCRQPVHIPCWNQVCRHCFYAYRLSSNDHSNSTLLLSSSRSIRVTRKKILHRCATSVILPQLSIEHNNLLHLTLIHLGIQIIPVLLQERMQGNTQHQHDLVPFT